MKSSIHYPSVNVKLSALEKKCTKCRRYLDSTCFHKDKNKKDGLYHICKDCRAGRTKAPSVPSGHRMCKICDEIKPIDQYYKCKTATRLTCIDCSESRWTKSYKIVPGRFPNHLKQSLLGYLSPSEQRALLRSSPEFRKRDNAADRRYRKTKKGREKAQEWKAKNREKLKDYQHIRRSQMLDLPYDFTEESWKITLQEFDYRCVYCSVESDELARDHWIPSSKGGGYILGNIVPSCKPCNSSKRDKLPINFCSKEKFIEIEKTLKNLRGITV